MLCEETNSEEHDMTRLISRIFPFADRAQHGAGRRSRLRASVQADREQLIGPFVD
jgi:hypothetical protein